MTGQGSARLMRPFSRCLKDERAGVLALVALFLPVAIFSAGMVADLGMVFVARKAVQAACDLGALAGVLELDWDRLAAGEVLIREDDGADIAKDIARQNLDSVLGMLSVLSVECSVRNPPGTLDPVVSVEIRYAVATRYLRWVPGLKSGFEGRAFSEASVVERTRW